MQRQAFKMKLIAGCEKEYEKRHKQLWPELRAILKDAGISGYSIFLDKETSTLFAYQHVKDGVSSQDMGNDPVVQKWWDYMADIMEVNADNSPISIPLEEVFFMP